jgi:tripartite-type tricarboxylate transporter receptor subunit TctC
MFLDRYRGEFMSKPHFVRAALVIGLVTLGTGVTCAQEYPHRPIRIVCAAPGGGADFVARLIAQGITGSIGQPIIVENRPSNLTGEIVMKAIPDGYTLLLAGGTFMFAPLLSKMPYDPIKDFSAISMLAKAPNVIVVHPSVAAKSVKELIALAKARPAELNYASGGNGSSLHLSGELFKAMAGVNIARINYKGTGPAINDLVGGQVQVAFSSAATVAPHIKSGRLRALAVTSLQPSPLAPGLPTATASGLPGYEVESIDYMLAPARVPALPIKVLNQEIVRALNQSDLKEKFLNAGIEATGSTPAQLATILNSEIAKWRKVIKDAGIHAD